MIYDLFKEWDACRDWLLPAIERTYGTHNEDDVIAMLLKGEAKLWRGERSAIVTEIVQYPRMKCLNFFLVGGNMEDLLENLQPKIFAYALSRGCSRVQCAGRKGWERVLPYEYGGVFMYKDLI